MQEGVFSTHKGSEAHHCTAFSGMEVGGGGALGMGAESSRKVPGNGVGPRQGMRAVCPAVGLLPDPVYPCPFPGPQAQMSSWA